MEKIYLFWWSPESRYIVKTRVEKDIQYARTKNQQNANDVQDETVTVTVTKYGGL